MKKGIIKITICSIFFILANIVKLEWLQILFFFASYLSIGYEVIFEAFEGIK